MNVPVPFEGLEGLAKNFRLKSTILPTRKLIPIEQKLRFGFKMMPHIMIYKL